MISRRAFVLGGGALVGGLAGAVVGGAVKSHLFGEQIATFRGLGEGFEKLAFSPDNSLLAIANSKSIGLWDISNYKKRKISFVNNIRHRRDAEGFQVAPSITFIDEGNSIELKSGELIEVWDVKSEKIIERKKDSSSYVRFLSKAGGLIADIPNLPVLNPRKKSSFKVFSSSENEKNILWEFSMFQHEIPQYVSFSNDARFVVGVSVGLANKVYIWDMRTGKKVQQIEGDFKTTTPAYFSKSGRYLFFGTVLDGLQMIKKYPVFGYQYQKYFSDLYIRVWDVEKKQFVKKLKGHKRYISDLAITPDKKLLASSSADKTVRVWDLEAVIG